MQAVLNVDDVRNVEQELTKAGVSLSELMRRAGFRLVLFGVESANQATLDRFVKALKVASRVINRKNSLPLLADVKLTFDGTQLLMTSGNGEAFVAQPLADYAVVDGPKGGWAVCANPDLLLRGLGEIGDRRLTITIDEKLLISFFSDEVFDRIGDVRFVDFGDFVDVDDSAQSFCLQLVQFIAFLDDSRYLLCRNRQGLDRIGRCDTQPGQNGMLHDEADHYGRAEYEKHLFVAESPEDDKGSR